MSQKKKLPSFNEIERRNIRVINLRYFLFGAVAMVLGIILAKNNSLTVGAIVLLAMAVGLLVFIIKHKRRLILATLICVVCFCVGGASFIVRSNAWFDKEVDSTVVYELSGELAEGYVFDIEGLEFSGTLKNIRLDGKKTNASCYIYITLSDYRSMLAFAETGDIISFKARLNNISFLDSSSNISYLAIKNIRYSASNVDDGIGLTDKPTPLTAIIRKKLAQENERWLGKSYGAIATAMLTGDTTDLEKDVGYYFSGAGIFHILSVSGSHITFISAFLMLLMSKIRIRRYKKSIILSSILIMYLAVCNFVSPASRSVIMGILASFGASIGQRNDSLSNLSVSAIILLLINPLLLFDGSFQLSFCATLGIICLTRPITRLINRVSVLKKMPDSLIQAIAISFSAQLGTVVVSMYRLQSFSFYAVIANVTLMPILMASFTISFTVGFISLALPFLSFLNAISYPLIHLTIEGSRLFAIMPFSLIIVFATAIIAWVYLGTLFSSSGFVMLKPKLKRITLLAFSGVFLLLAISFNTSQAFSREVSVHSFNTKIGLTDLFITSEGSVYLAGDLRDYGILEILNNNKVRRIDSLIMTNYSSEAFRLANALIMKYSIRQIYLADDRLMRVGELSEIVKIKFLEVNKPNKLNGMSVTLFAEENRVLGLLAELEGKKVLQIGATKQSFITFLNTAHADVELLHCFIYNNKMPIAKNIIANYFTPDIKVSDNGRYGVNFSLMFN